MHLRARAALAALGAGLAALSNPAGADDLTAGNPLPPDRLAIALRVAGAGLPDCRSYHADGSEGPCLPVFAVHRGGGVNAWSQAGRIGFSRAALTTLNDDQFALLAGHEIAHWYLGHHGSTPQNEREADRLGGELACRAGFDLARGTALFHQLQPDWAHARPQTRIGALLAQGCAAPAAPLAALLP